MARIGIAIGALFVGLLGGLLLAGYLGDGDDRPVVVAADTAGSDPGVSDPGVSDVETAERRDRHEVRREHLGKFGDERAEALRGRPGDLGDGPIRPRHWSRGSGWDHCELLESFADELGVSADEVVSAARAVLDQRLRSAVDDGRVDAPKADRILGMFDRHEAACTS